MAVTLHVSYEVLIRTRTRWDHTADQLDGSWRRLSKTSTGGLSAEVSTAVDAFRDPWVDEIKASAERAQDNSDEIVLLRHELVVEDEAHAERIRSLLPWAQHAAEISS